MFFLVEKEKIKLSYVEFVLINEVFCYAKLSRSPVFLVHYKINRIYKIFFTVHYCHTLTTYLLCNMLLGNFFYYDISLNFNVYTV